MALLARHTLAAIAVVLLALLPVTAARAAAFTWSAPQTLLDEPRSGPWDAMTDAAGNGLVLLEGDWRAGGVRFLERPAGGGWSAPVSVSAPRRYAAWPDAAAAGDGAAAAVWVENRRRAYQRVWAVVRDPGGALGARRLVSPLHGTGVRRVRVAVDARGDALAAWEADVPHSYDVGHIEAAYRPAGSDFGHPRRVSSDGAAFPQVAISPDGHGVIGWARGPRVEAIAVEDGNFGAVRAIGVSGSASHTANAFAPEPPALAVGPDGGAVIAWLGVLPDRGRSVEDEDTRPRVIRAARRAPGGRFGDATVLRTVHARDGVTLGLGLAAAAGPAGRAEVVWEEDRFDAIPDHSRGRNGIFSRLHGAYAAPGRGFGDPSPVSPAQDGYVTQPALAFAPDGTLAAAWGWYADAQHSGLQVARGRDGLFGAVTTVSEPVPLDWGIYDVMAPRLAVDGHGIATAFWRQQFPVTEGSTTFYNDTHIQTATATPAP